ncbi:MAG: ABC transporter ATP-binding protein [Halobacteriaceae archaeon]
MTATLAGEGLTVRFASDGESVTVFEDIDLEVRPGEFLSIMGPSGCGKTTLLNALTGLVPLASGTVSYDGADIDPGAFSFGYVFQEPRLLDWRTVSENVAFALRGAGVPEGERDARVAEWLDRVGLGDSADAYPRALSGGMRQRVGVARALAVDPEVLFMDEPFGSLDDVTARMLRRDLLDLWADTGKEVVFVTHDVSEAVALSDRVLFMGSDGAFFDEATVDHERPRDFDDPALRETERRLSERFFAELA